MLYNVGEYQRKVYDVMQQNISELDRMPILRTEEQIVFLRKNGVQFSILPEEAAKTYLRNNNNFFRLYSYRNNFDKHPGGEHEGEYIDLDFAILVDLAVIDMRLRHVLLKMALDVEHFAKVKLMNIIADKQDDGVQIVADYIAELQETDRVAGTSRYKQLRDELERNTGDPYCGEIMPKWEKTYPIWVFLELASLGRFSSFLTFCAKRLQDKDLKEITYLLKPIKTLRNATAHNHCLLFDMRPQKKEYSINDKMVMKLSPISKNVRHKKLSNERTRQISTLLYAHAYLVKSEGVHKRAQEELHEIVDRMYKNISYYSKNAVITTNLDFFRKVVDICFP